MIDGYNVVGQLISRERERTMDHFAERETCGPVLWEREVGQVLVERTVGQFL